MADPSPFPGTGDDAGVGRNRESTTGALRGVKVVGIILVVLILLIVAMVLTGVFGGEHGPGRHATSGGGPTPPSSVVLEDHTAQGWPS